MSKRRGRKASFSGAAGEEMFEALANAAGFETISRRNSPALLKRYLVNQPETFKPWGVSRSGKQDHEIYSEGRRVLVQVKNQNTNGTCDEKLAFCFDLYRSTPGYDEYWLVLMGIEWRENPGRLGWLRRKARETELFIPRARVRVFHGPSEVQKALAQL